MGRSWQFEQQISCGRSSTYFWMWCWCNKLVQQFNVTGVAYMVMKRREGQGDSW